MDAFALQELTARADAAAGAEGAGAGVTLESLPPSDVEPGGPRVVLAVFCRVNGQMRESAKSYRPECNDLPIVIEKDAAEMARRLLGLEN